MKRRSVARRKYPAHIRIGACADYLLGMSCLKIVQKWDVATMGTVLNWIRKTGHFKLRNKHSNRYSG